MTGSYTRSEVVDMVRAAYLRGWDDGYGAIQTAGDGLEETLRCLGLPTTSEEPTP